MLAQYYVNICISGCSSRLLLSIALQRMDFLLSNLRRFAFVNNTNNNSTLVRVHECVRTFRREPLRVWFACAISCCSGIQIQLSEIGKSDRSFPLPLSSLFHRVSSTTRSPFSVCSPFSRPPCRLPILHFLFHF